jgi:hypothetical protein
VGLISSQPHLNELLNIRQFFLARHFVHGSENKRRSRPLSRADRRLAFVKRASIQIGDLLVTSDVAGVVMKSEPIKVGGRLMHMPGNINREST